MKIHDNFMGPRNGERRIGCDRRQYSYTHFIPERRSNIERRSADSSTGAVEYAIAVHQIEEAIGSTAVSARNSATINSTMAAVS
jgi:hypothetical protein